MKCPETDSNGSRCILISDHLGDHFSAGGITWSPRNANSFDCGCGHPVHRHNRKVWPHYTPHCDDCECRAYTPIWKSAKGANQ